jgi:AraC-like DNA-binding protein
MRKASKHIPVNKLPIDSCGGIMMMRESFHGSPNSKEVERSHRDGGYTFIIQEKGITNIEIDFQTFLIQAPSVIYLHPNQVHRLIAFEHATISTWIVTEENIRPEYLSLLDNLTPVTALTLEGDILSILTETAALCMRLTERKEEKLFNNILKESCNTLVALVASQYLKRSKPIDHYTRYEIVTKAFKQELEHQFKTIKSPASYASHLNLSTPYLNECVKVATGQSVSRHIQQRVILEAKRLLYHSSKSVKEIAAELGIDDYSYFTRLFRKVAGMTPVEFRNKNCE